MGLNHQGILAQEDMWMISRKTESPQNGEGRGYDREGDVITRKGQEYSLYKDYSFSLNDSDPSPSTALAPHLNLISFIPLMCAQLNSSFCLDTCPSLFHLKVLTSLSLQSAVTEY
jgi:hypothetical protein